MNFNVISYLAYDSGHWTLMLALMVSDVRNETYLFFAFVFVFFSYSLILKLGSQIITINKGLYKYLLRDLFLKITKKLTFGSILTTFVKFRSHP